MAARQVTVVVAAGHTVYRDGVGYREGLTIRVSPAEAKQLLDAGYAEKK